MTLKRVILIRHGETRHTVEGRFCGTDDPELTPAGVAAAQALVGLATLRPIERLLSSPARRAVATAAPIAAALGLEVTIDGAFAETAFGKWEGKRYATVRGTAAHGAWSQDPSLHAPPGGETGLAVQRRAVDALARQLEQADDIALVSHKGTIRLIFSHYTQAAARDYRRLPDVPPASISQLVWRGGRLLRATLGEAAQCGTRDGARVDTEPGDRGASEERR